MRTKAESFDIIVSAGKGLIESLDKVKSFDDGIGAELSASRRMVDAGGFLMNCRWGLQEKQ